MVEVSSSEEGSARLLSIFEAGGYPDFSGLYKEAGYEVVQATSMRKGLLLLKKKPPKVVVAEFIYSPTYGARISSLESLLAALQAGKDAVTLIVFLEKKRDANLDTLVSRFPVHTRLFYPISPSALQAALNSLFQ